MNRNLINIFCTVMIFSCKPAVVVDKVNVDTYDILLQDSRKGRLYIYLTKDMAYYEEYVLDKPSYFTARDTLARVDKENIKGYHYEGKHVMLYITEQGYNVSYTSGEAKGKTRLFSAAGKKEEQKWNEYRNGENFGHVANTIGSVLNKPYSSASEYHVNLHRDWKELQQLIPKLNQKEFSVALEHFKTKYSIP